MSHMNLMTMQSLNHESRDLLTPYGFHWYWGFGWKVFWFCEDYDTLSNITVVDAIKNYKEDTNQSSTHTKFKINYNRINMKKFLLTMN